MPKLQFQSTLSVICFYVFSCYQDGEVVYVDWMPQKDQDTGKIQSKLKSVIPNSNTDGLCSQWLNSVIYWLINHCRDWCEVIRYFWLKLQSKSIEFGSLMS